MKILLASNVWQGRFIEHIGKSFEKNGQSIEYALFPVKKKHVLKKLKLTQLLRVNNFVNEWNYLEYNKYVKQKILNNNYDIFFVFSGGSRLYPDTVKFIREKGIKTVCYIGDNPFDSSRDSYMPMTLQHYDIIIGSEKTWAKNIKNLAPKAKIIKSIGGYNQTIFYPVNKETITKQDITRFECDISFTGANYGGKAEGAYRSGILNQLYEFDTRIWGYGDWPNRFKYFPNLKQMYKGKSLSWDDLKKLYTLSRININMPSPQVVTSFQPRVFDIAATKGFQIIDEREALWDYFTEDEIVVFKGIPDLKEKIKYYLNNPKAREEKIEKMYNKVVKEYTWDNQIAKLLKKISQ